MFDDDRQKSVYFGAICVLGLVMRLACFTGLIASDDLAYSHAAQLIAQHHYVPEPHPFGLRYGLTIPVAIAYRLFGLKEWTSVLVPLLASAASIPLLMLIGMRLFDFRRALIAGTLLATFPVALRSATILVPEPVAGFYILGAILTYLYAENRSALLVTVASGIFLGVAYLTKEPAVLVGPAIVLDAATRRQWRGVMGLAVGIAMVIAAEQLYYLVVSGDPMFRAHAMLQHNRVLNPAEVNRNLSYRLFRSYPLMMLVPDREMGFHSLFSLALVIFGVPLLKLKRSGLLLLWALLPLLYINFGSWSLARYLALPIATRYLEIVYPPLFLLAAAVLDRTCSSGNAGRLLGALAVVAVAATGFGCGFLTRGQDWRTADVKALRLIARKAKEKHLATVRFEGDQEGYWEQTMAILASELRVTTDPARADLVVRPDAFALPSAALTSNHRDASGSELPFRKAK